MAAKRPRTKRILGILAYVAAAFCLFWVFRGIDFHSFLHQFQILKPLYLLIAIGFSVAVYFANSWRWWILLSPIAEVKFWKTVQSVYIGLFLNEVLPLRPGEVVRCYLLSRWTRLRISSVFASAALERLLDGLWTLAGFFAVAMTLKLPKSLVTGARILAIGIIVITCIWIVHVIRGRTRNSPAPDAEKTKSGFLDALRFMGDLRVVIAATLVSGISLACLILAMWFLMKGGSFDLSLAAAAAVFLIIRVGTVIPNAPGNIGSYQFFCVLAMGMFGVDKSAAAAFAILNFTVFTVPLLIGGTIAVAASGLKFSALTNAAES